MATNRHHPPGNRRQLDADGHVQTNSVSAAPAFFADFQHAARRSRQKQEHKRAPKRAPKKEHRKKEHEKLDVPASEK